MGQLSTWFAELEALIGVEQNPRFHAEGDVFAHTMLVLDEAAALCGRVSNPFGLMLGALVHDFGKAVCTEEKDGVIHAYGHETAGLPLARTFLERITAEHKGIELALNLTEHHMKPLMKLRAHASSKSMNRMFDEAIDPEALIAMALADDRGRRMTVQTEPNDDDEALHAHLAAYRACMAQPYVMGRDLIAAGFAPGEEFTELLTHAHKLRLAGVPKEQALKQTIAFARERGKIKTRT